jgi:hypothetical protein
MSIWETDQPGSALFHDRRVRVRARVRELGMATAEMFRACLYARVSTNDRQSQADAAFLQACLAFRANLT